MEHCMNHRERAQAIEQIVEFMRAKKLTAGDLIEIGGEDLRSSSPTRSEKAHRVEKCWALMARLGVKYADLSPEQPSKIGPFDGLHKGGGLSPPLKPSGRRGEGVFLQAIENKEISPLGI
jgi:hypothetical protein